MAIEPMHFELRSEATWARVPPWERRVGRATAYLRCRYARLPRRVQMTTDIVAHLVLPFVLGLAVYLPTELYAPALLDAWYIALVSALLAIALLISVECARACRFPDPPLEALSREQLPTIGVVVAAYLVNEADTIMESLHHQLSVDYPADKLVVVCAYNTPRPLPVEAELAALASEDPRFIALCVEGSTSKAENVNAALDYLNGHVDVIGFYDADHHPHPSVPLRVARWLGDAAGKERYDVVQGQCTIRNADDSFVSATVAAEFAMIYAVSHPGRTTVNGFGIFGGSNGFWRTEMINRIGMSAEMLTEDIDATSRALLEGARIATDPRMVSTELAPVSWNQLWRQRMRWAQGWWEVTVRHTGPLLRSPRLNDQQKRGVVFLYVWRIVHPWLATQMWPLMAALVLVHGSELRRGWGVPIFVLTTVLTMGMPMLQALVAQRLAPPGIRERSWLFWRFGLISMVFYSEFKAIINRAAVVRDLFGVHQWTVTPRSRAATRRRRTIEETA
jgi:cellulose synthase/poly-beta-1,6-N-acetylglucosamine synthase-like glycosyltransferase